MPDHTAIKKPGHPEYTAWLLSLQPGDPVGVSAKDAKDYYGVAKVRLTSPFAFMVDDETFPKFSALIGECFGDSGIHLEELSDNLRENLRLEPYYKAFLEFCRSDMEDFTVQERQAMYAAIMEHRTKLAAGESTDYPPAPFVPRRKK